MSDELEIEKISNELTFDLSQLDNNFVYEISNLYVFDISKYQKLQLEINPTIEQQTFTPQDGYLYDKVIVNAVDNTIDSNITPTNIRAGVSILGINGNLEPDKPDQSKTATPSESEQTIVADTGYELASVTISAIQTESKTVIPDKTQQTITPTSGKYIKQVTVEAIPNIYIEPSGTIDITANGTVDVTQYASANVNVENKLASLVDKSITEVTAEDLAGATKIGDYAFQDCSSLTSIIIPSGVTSLGNNGFFSCSGLTSINIPSSVIDIGSQCFANCTNLKTIHIDSLESYLRININSNWAASPTCNGGLLYLNNEPLYEIIIPDTIIKINSYIFYKNQMTSVIIPESVTSIGDYAFRYCTSLTSVTIPDSVTVIGSQAFRNCSKLTSINIPNSVTRIGEYVFSSCTSLTSITIPDNVKAIYGYAFYWCTGLINIVIPDSVTSIGSNAFSNCTSLTSVIIGNGITSIESQAFNYCSSLTEMTILAETPPTLSNINAISSATTTIYVPAGTKTAYETATNWSALTTRGTNPVTYVELPSAIEQDGDNLIINEITDTITQDGSNLIIGGE